MRNVDHLLALAAEQNSRDLVQIMQAPAHRLIGLLNARAAQMRDPGFERRSFQRELMETGW